MHNKRRATAAAHARRSAKTTTITTAISVATVVALTLGRPAEVSAQQAPVQEAPARVLTPFPPSRSFVEFDSTVTHTDNALRTLHGTSDDTIIAAGLNLDYRRQGTRLDLRGRGNINYLDYLNNTYSARALGFFDGLGLLRIVEDNFVWTAEETFGQALRDPFQANTQKNLENVNAITTGPRVTFGDINRFSAYGLYSRTTYADADLDSKSLTGGMALAHSISPLSTVSANVVSQQVKFDDTAPGTNLDYDVHQLFGRYETRGGRTTIVSDVGYTVLKQDLSESKGGLLLRLDAARAISGRSSVYFSAAREYSTAEGLLRGDSPVGAPVETSTPTAAADPFLDKTVALGWVFNGRRTRFALNGSWLEESHEQRTEFDRKIKLIGAQLERLMSPTISGRLLIQQQWIDYTKVGTSDHETFVHAELTKRFGLRLRGSLAYNRYQRRTPEGVTDYGENQISVGFIYTMVGAY